MGLWPASRLPAGFRVGKPAGKPARKQDCLPHADIARVMAFSCTELPPRGSGPRDRSETILDKVVGAVILFGPPGAGKGTQARSIGQKLGIPHISTGDMIRLQVAADSAMGRSARDIMERGILIPDE